MTLPARIVASVLCLAGIFAAVQLRAHDRDARLAPARFADQYTLTSRRPDVATSLALAPSGDFASDLVADATLRDVTLPANLRGLDPRTRMAWIDAVPRYDEQLSRAGDLMLDAIAERPGWPYHQALLGQLTFARAARNLSPELVTKYERWSVPLYEGAQSAGTDDGLWESLALAYLQTWPDLGRVHGSGADRVFRRALSDPDFVQAAFAPALDILGEGTAVDLLPDRASSLRQAFVILANRNSVRRAWDVHQRWETSEWRERTDDLAKIRKAATGGDDSLVARLCDSWIDDHSFSDYDSPEGRGQIVELLNEWPTDRKVLWGRDRRGEAVRFLLGAGRLSEPNPAFSQTVDRMRDVPPAVEAESRLIGGDVKGAEAIALGASDGGSFEWTPYLIRLARFWSSRDPARAIEAAKRISAAAQQSCDVVVLRHEPLDQVVSDAKVDAHGQGTIRTCVANAQLNLDVECPTPSVLDVLADGGRRQSLLIDGHSRTSLPVEPGLRVIELKNLAGTQQCRASTLTATRRPA